LAGKGKGARLLREPVTAAIHARFDRDVERIVEISGLFPRRNRRFAAFRKGFRRKGTLGGDDEKLRNGNAQSLYKAVQKIDGGIFCLPLQAPDIGSVDVGVIGKSLLRNSALNADPPQIPSYKRASFHARRQPVERPLNHWI
jgi:hypothetical protein